MTASDPDTSFLVFDVGGTTQRAALYDPVADDLVSAVTGCTASRWSEPAGGEAELLDRLIDDLDILACELGAPASPDIVAIGFPAPIDGSGRAVAVPTILGDAFGSPFAVATLLERRWPQAEICVTNDVTAAGFALLAHDRGDVCVLTIGSGIGMKVFVDGRPLLGPRGTAGEIGHLVVDRAPDANRCDCGGRGHLGAVASGRGTLVTARRRAREDPRSYAASMVGATEPTELDTYALAAAFRCRDAWATSVIAEGAGALGTTLAAIHSAIGIEPISLYGGFATALGEPYRRLVAAAAQGGCWDIGQRWDEILTLSDLDGRAGLLGAGRYARAMARERLA